MCVCSTGCGPSKSSIEYQRRRKPENNMGCGCSRAENTCESDSLAEKDSPLGVWEKKYGKLVTTVTLSQDSFGKKIQLVEKKPCPKINKKAKTCCSVGYRVYR